MNLDINSFRKLEDQQLALELVQILHKKRVTTAVAKATLIKTMIDYRDLKEQEKKDARY